jgi:hypothetical protein
VLNVSNYLGPHTNTSRTIAYDENRIIKKHAQFHSHILALGDFVPCIDGVPISEDSMDELLCAHVLDKREKVFAKDMIILAEQFQQAKSRVLFEGLIDNEVSLYTLKRLLGKLLVTVEDIQKYYNVTLTEAALKQLR